MNKYIWIAGLLLVSTQALASYEILQCSVNTLGKHSKSMEEFLDSMSSDAGIECLENISVYSDTAAQPSNCSAKACSTFYKGQKLTIQNVNLDQAQQRLQDKQERKQKGEQQWRDSWMELHGSTWYVDSIDLYQYQYHQDQNAEALYVQGETHIDRWFVPDYDFKIIETPNFENDTRGVSLYIADQTSKLLDVRMTCKYICTPCSSPNPYFSVQEHLLTGQ